MTRDDRVTEVLAACRERIDRGELVDPEAVIRDHPDLAEELTRRFAAQRRAEGMFRDGGSSGGAAVPDEPPPTTSLSGRALGPYRLGAVLGSGGMGTVYRATVEGRAPGLAAGEVVAVKVVHPHLLHREGFFKRFLREAEMGRRLRHANVVCTLDADAVPGEDGHTHFLVMEYVEGQTLRGLLDELGKVPEELCRHIGLEVTKALAAIHAEGVVHRDMKPENVLLTKDHAVKVMDLGVAQVGDEALRLSQTGAFVGSVRYAAPEQFRGRRAKVDGRADLYALGLTLYELATGKHPFEGDDFHDVIRRQTTEVARPAGELNPQLSPFFEEMLRALLAKDPAERPASAGDLRTALEDGERSSWWRRRAGEVRAATHRPLRRIRIPRDTALYGRDAELARLRALFDKAKSGDGQVVLVEGEAGIGKSRLVDEFVGTLRREGEDLDFLFGSYPPGGAATASGAFSTAYREHFGDARLAEALREALPQTPLLVPAFAALLQGDATPTGAEPLTKDSLQTVFVHATRSLAARRPTIVLIDDLHFAPDEGRALFASLALAAPEHRILLVGTARPGVPESWTSGIERLEHASRLALPRLGPKDLARLLVDAFRSERLAEELSFRIAAKSDGNPYFVFEILRGLREGQFLRQKPDGTWVTTQILHDIQIPSTIRDLVAARVADLAAEDKELLDVASCSGFEFDAGIVADAVGTGHLPVLKRLARIEAKHGLVRSAGERFVFDHHQVQETLYAGLPPPLAREYHAAIAAAIETRTDAASKEPKDLDGAFCVDLTEHFLKGAKGERALRFLDRALTHLEGGYLNDAAVRLTDLALAVPGLLAGRPRAEMLLRKATRLDFLGRRDAERAALEEAARLANEDGDLALRGLALGKLGVHFYLTSHNDEAIAQLREAQSLARAAGDRRFAGCLEGNLGTVFFRLGRFAEAREHHENHLAVAREIGDRRCEAGASINLGSVFDCLGRHAEAREHYERALVLGREIGDRRCEASSMGGVGVVFFYLGCFAEAREHLESQLALARDIGDRMQEGAAIGNLGGCFSYLGRFAEAQERHDRQLALAREIGYRTGEANATGNLGCLCSSLGCFAEAREHKERHLALAREIGNRWEEGYALQELADSAAGEGDDVAAERLLTEALELRRAIGQRGGEAESLRTLGALRARLGRTEEARATLAETLEIARALLLPDVELLATAGLAALPGGDLAAALAALAAREHRVPMSNAMEARFLLWQAAHDPAHLTEAKRLLDHLVAHAPADCRDSMLANVRLHRDIAAAAREHLAN